VPRAMRLLLPLLALALVAAALPASGQMPTFTQAYQVRGAVGDIPTTPAAEPAGMWNLAQQLAITFSNSSVGHYAFSVPAGASLVNATCGCPAQATPSAGTVEFTLPTSVPSGAYTLRVTTSQPYDQAFGFALTPPPTTAQDRVAILYVPTAFAVDAQVRDSGPGLTTDGSARIVVLDGVPSPFWVTFHPATLGAAAPAKAGGSASPMTWAIALVAGLVLGIVLWAVLVSKGVVQRKGRRQVAVTAAHVEAAAADPPAVLEGKKRALMAALKEVEVAKMANEMPAEVYDAVKADLKKQAVTVMRALEEGGAGETKA